MTLKDRANELKVNIPAMCIVLKKKDTPILAKILASLVVIYALSPIDLIPDFIPVLGYLDDVIILPVLIALTIKIIPDKIFKQCQEESKDLWINGKPKKWYYAIPFILIWLVVLFFILKLIL